LPKEERFLEMFARHYKTVVQARFPLFLPLSSFFFQQFEMTPTISRRAFFFFDLQGLITSMDDAIDQMQPPSPLPFPRCVVEEMAQVRTIEQNQALASLLSFSPSGY